MTTEWPTGGRVIDPTEIPPPEKDHDFLDAEWEDEGDAG
jgi:hypothetical protein